MSLKKQVRGKILLNSKLYSGGNDTFYLVYPEGQNDEVAKVCLVVIEKSIAYHGRGISYYKGISFFEEGQSLIEMKPTSLWRNGENQYADMPQNDWRIDSFRQQKGKAYQAVLSNSSGDVENWKIVRGKPVLT